MCISVISRTYVPVRAPFVLEKTQKPFHTRGALQRVCVRTRRAHCVRAEAEDITRTNGPWLTLAVIESEIFVEGWGANVLRAARWNGTCYHLGAHTPAAMMAPLFWAAFWKCFCIWRSWRPSGRTDKRNLCAPEIWEFKYAQHLLFDSGRGWRCSHFSRQKTLGHCVQSVYIFTLGEWKLLLYFWLGI
jgi:hypothetical protein